MIPMIYNETHAQTRGEIITNLFDKSFGPSSEHSVGRSGDMLWEGGDVLWEVEMCCGKVHSARSPRLLDLSRKTQPLAVIYLPS